MPNQLFRNRAKDAVQNAVRAAKSAIAVDHAGLRGRVRELASTDLIAPFLPGAFTIGTGQIVDAWDRRSAETDLIIYSKTVLPPVMYSDRDGVFPIEACFYAIEVKSVLTAQEIDDTIRKMRTLQALRYQSGEYDDKGVAINHQLRSVVPTLFAFESDLSPNASDGARYLQRDAESHSNPALRVLCVVGRGYWRFDAANGKWLFHEPSSDGDEVIDFLSGIANTLPDALVSRRRPRLGNYLMLPSARSGELTPPNQPLQPTSRGKTEVE